MHVCALIIFRYYIYILYIYHIYIYYLWTFGSTDTFTNNSNDISIQMHLYVQFPFGKHGRFSPPWDNFTSLTSSPELHRFIVGVYIPIIRMPVIKGGMSDHPPKKKYRLC